MPLLVDETGLTIQSQAEIATEAAAKLQEPAIFGPTADVSDASTLGRLNDVESEREAVVQNALEAIVANLNPNVAVGYHLDALCLMVGVRRDPATYALSDQGRSTTSGATTIPANAIVRNDRTLQDWVVVSDVIAGGAGTYNTTIRGRETGVQTFLETDTWTIVTPTAQWDSFESFGDSTTSEEGTDVETDEELREKRKLALLAAGNDFEAIKASVAQVTGVTYVGGYNNKSTGVVYGVPGGAIEVVVEGGDADEIAQAIYEHIPPGTESFGDETAVVTLDTGEPLNIYFSRPTEIDFYVKITVDATGAEYAVTANLEDLVIETVLATAQATMSDPGADVIPRALERDLWNATADARTGRPTLISINAEVSLNDADYFSTPYVIAHDERAIFDAARISLVMTGGA